jgi:drug/metabolite transporter (DMT)-like permease
VISVAFAFLASILWGLSDFVGGILSRRFSVAAVALLTQTVGLVAAGVLVAAAGQTFDGQGVALGLVSGVSAAVSLSAFYKAMTIGQISLASPILACGSVIAFGLALAAGERPSTLAIFGSAMVIAGIVVTSLEERHDSGRRDAFLLMILSAVGFGFSIYLLGRASGETGSVVAVFAQRITLCSLLLVVAIKVRPAFGLDWRSRFAVIGIGLGTTAAALLFGIAANRGLISIAAVVGSMYPLVTVVLARSLLSERFRGTQVIGIPLALFGVGLVAAGH